MKARDKWRKVQAIIGTKEDGIPGTKDEAAITLLRSQALSEYRGTDVPIPTIGDLVDERSEKNIATLLPHVRPIARAFVKAAAAEGITIKVIDGSRTYAQQDALYAKGRTKPGPEVTKARGGYSNHNFGIAFDIGVFKGGKWIPESPLYKAVAVIGKRLGLRWGGDWTSLVDEPHYEYNPKGHSIAKLRALTAAGASLA